MASRLGNDGTSSPPPPVPVATVHSPRSLRDDATLRCALRALLRPSKESTAAATGHSLGDGDDGDDGDGGMEVEWKERKTSGSRVSSPCHFNGEGMASFVLSGCCANPCNHVCNHPCNKVHPDDAVNPVVEGVGNMSMMTPKGRKSRWKGNRHSAGEAWEQRSAGKSGGGWCARSNSTPEFPTGSIGPGEIIGMALPCAGQGYARQNSDSYNSTVAGNDPRDGNVGRNSARRRSGRPFASDPLIDEGDSLVERNGSLMSLIGSDTTLTTATPTTVASSGINAVNNAAYSTPDNSERERGYRTPPLSKNHKRIGSGSVTPNRTPRTGYRGARTSPVPAFESSPLAPDSPAIELSMAKQVANRAQMSDARKNNREGLRNYRTPNKPKRNGSSGSLAGSSLTPPMGVSGSSASSSPNRGKNGKTIIVSSSLAGDDQVNIVNSSIDASSRTEANSSTDATRVTEPYTSFDNAPPAPVWEAAADGSVNSELASTYKHPRLYLRDPSQVIAENWDRISGNNTNGNGELWWFHLAQRMETTLKHVQDNRWKALSERQHRQIQQNVGGSDSSAASSSAHQQQQQHSFSCAGLEVTNVPSDSCVTVRDLCLGEPQCRQQIRQRNSTPTRTRRRPSPSPHSNSKHKPKKGAPSGAASGASSSAATFDPSVPPVNVWSEPSATTFKVRGPTYSKDGIKVESEPSIFSLVGADSFVDGDGDRSASASGCRERWGRACEGAGLDSPPFLLVINFIVPWGNFQAYFVRPDADEGPFSSRRRGDPSEKAWREFMEGSTEYRNKRLKLIPRICTGPWVVKRMVGSTPAIIGTKLPVSYRGSVDENYLEVDLDVTGGPAIGNSIANTVVGRADAVTVDLGFVVEGREEDGHLPERMLGLVRLHHLNMKEAPTRERWKEESSRKRR